MFYYCIMVVVLNLSKKNIQKKKLNFIKQSYCNLHLSTFYNVPSGKLYMQLLKKKV